MACDDVSLVPEKAAIFICEGGHISSHYVQLAGTITLMLFPREKYTFSVLSQLGLILGNHADHY